MSGQDALLLLFLNPSWQFIQILSINEAFWSMSVILAQGAEMSTWSPADAIYLLNWKLLQFPASFWSEFLVRSASASSQKIQRHAASMNEGWFTPKVIRVSYMHHFRWQGNALHELCAQDLFGLAYASSNIYISFFFDWLSWFRLQYWGRILRIGNVRTERREFRSDSLLCFDWNRTNNSSEATSEEEARSSKDSREELPNRPNLTLIRRICVSSSGLKRLSCLVKTRK